MDAFLEDLQGKRIPLKDGFVIGRVAGCDLVIADVKASRRHARVLVVGCVVEVEDLESANGTLLNGKPVQRRVLRPGDQITIGTTVLRYGEGQAGTPSPTVAKQSAREPASGSREFEPEELDFGGSDPQPAPRALPVPAPLPPRTPAQPAPEVLEFVDEVVDVRRREPAVKPGSPTAASLPAGTAPPIVRRSGVLLFQAEKNASKNGLLGDDMAQMSIGMRLLLMLLGLGVAGALGWLVMTLVK